MEAKMPNWAGNSPLARLNVALDPVRTRSGETPTTLQMEGDLRRLDEVIARLLTISKLEAEGELRQPRQVDLSALVASIVKDTLFEAGGRHIKFNVDQQAHLIVSGEPSLLRSAIENILRNAVRFREPGTDIDIALRAAPSVMANQIILTALTGWQSEDGKPDCSRRGAGSQDPMAGLPDRRQECRKPHGWFPM